MPKVITPSMRKIWLGDSGTYPVIFCIAGACGWGAYMSFRTLFYNPDVTIDRKERGSLFKESREARAHAWVESHKKYKTDPSTIRLI